MYDKFHATSSEYLSRTGGRTLPYESITDALESLCDTLNFTEIWLKVMRKTTCGIVIHSKKT